jgi:hypothetical protein
MWRAIRPAGVSLRSLPFFCAVTISGSTPSIRRLRIEWKVAACLPLE